MEGAAWPLTLVVGVAVGLAVGRFTRASGSRVTLIALGVAGAVLTNVAMIWAAGGYSGGALSLLAIGALGAAAAVLLLKVPGLAKRVLRRR